MATWLNSRYLKCSVSQAEMTIFPICSFSDSQFWWMVFLSKHLLKVENLEIILTVSSLAPISKLYSASEISINFHPSSPPPLLLPWPLPLSLTSPTNLPASSFLPYSPAGNYLTKSESFHVSPLLRDIIWLARAFRIKSSVHKIASQAFLNLYRPLAILSPVPLKNLQPAV